MPKGLDTSLSISSITYIESTTWGYCSFRIFGLPDEEDHAGPSTRDFKNGWSDIVLFCPIFFKPRGWANKAPPFPALPDQGIWWIGVPVEDDYS